ncbi:hypothetical protein P3S67_012198 [Capsicum chacoense]
MGSNSASQTAGKPIRCQAAVCRKAGEPLIIEEIEVAPPMLLGSSNQDYLHFPLSF